MNTEKLSRFGKARRDGEPAPRAPILVSKREAAALLSVCVRTLDTLIARRELPARRVGKRVLIPYASLLTFANRDHATKRVATATGAGPEQVQ